MTQLECLHDISIPIGTLEWFFDNLQPPWPFLVDPYLLPLYAHILLFFIFLQAPQPMSPIHWVIQMGGPHTKPYNMCMKSCMPFFIGWWGIVGHWQWLMIHFALHPLDPIWSLTYRGGPKKPKQGFCRGWRAKHSCIVSPSMLGYYNPTRPPPLPLPRTI
jgi:hypothetical protein